MTDSQITNRGVFRSLSTGGKFLYILQVLGVFVFTLLAIYLVSFVVTNDFGEDVVVEEDAVTTATRPDSIVIEKIGLEYDIQKPVSAQISVLDSALRQGVVHYPGSGTVEEGNIFLFGHSADIYANVVDSALKVFNGLYKLEEGDTIILRAQGKEYIYSVDSVTLADASTAFVDLTKTEQKLTLSTCNTFGKQQERWVVEASLEEIKG